MQQAELDIITQLPREVINKLPALSQVGLNDAQVSAVLKPEDRKNRDLIIAARITSMMLALDMPLPEQLQSALQPANFEKVKKMTTKVRLRYDPRFQFVKELNKNTLKQMFKVAEDGNELDRLQKFSVELGEGKPIDEVATAAEDLPFVKRIYREMHHRECFKFVSRQLPNHPLTHEKVLIAKKKTHRKAVQA